MKQILINNVPTGSRQFYAGTEFDTVSEAQTIAQLTSCGGIFLPKENPQVAAAALQAQALLKRGGLATDEGAAAAIMQAALASVTAKRSFDLTLIAGTRAKSDDLTITANTTVSVALKTPIGTGGQRYLPALVVGGPGTGSVTVTAIDAAGATVIADLSVVTVTLQG